LLELDGTAKVVGDGPAYFLEATTSPEVCAHKLPLTFTGISVQRVAPNQSFQLKTWKGEGDAYTLSVVKGAVKSSSAAHNPY
jgi:cyanophycinase-like exopeptidase